MNEGRCIICGSADVKLWTLDSEGLACVTYLCKRDAAPLQAVMDAAGGVPPSRQRPPRPGEEVKVPIKTGGPRMKPMVPLEWEPPKLVAGPEVNVSPQSAMMEDLRATRTTVG